MGRNQICRKKVKSNPSLSWAWPSSVPAFLFFFSIVFQGTLFQLNWNILQMNINQIFIVSSIRVFLVWTLKSSKRWLQFLVGKTLVVYPRSESYLLFRHFLIKTCCGVRYSKCMKLRLSWFVQYHCKFLIHILFPLQH